MAKVRVFQNPVGTIRIMQLNERHRLPSETDEQFFARETTKQPELAGLVFVDVDMASLPTDRSKRYAWRLNAGTVLVDATVLPPQNPKQALLDQIDAATTVQQLKSALRKLVMG